MWRHASLALVPLLALGLASAALAQHEMSVEQWIEMRKMHRDTGPPPSIEEDVAALGGPEASRAGPRLIDRGPEVLPAVHAALLGPPLDPEHASRLLQVVGPLADASSVPVVLEVLERDDLAAIRRDALLVLAMLPPTDAAAARMDALARSDDAPWHLQRMAYTWYGLQRDERGRPHAERLRAHPDPARRAAALYVLARLGDATALDDVTAMLLEGVPGSVRDVLLLALAELTTPEEFERRVPAPRRGTGAYEDALRWTRYRSAGPDERPRLCAAMLRSQIPGHRGTGVRCLLDTGHADVLRPYAAVDLEAPGRAALVRNEIRKAGWQIVDTDDEFRIAPPS